MILILKLQKPVFTFTPVVKSSQYKKAYRAAFKNLPLQDSIITNTDYSSLF